MPDRLPSARAIRRDLAARVATATQRVTDAAERFAATVEAADDAEPEATVAENLAVAGVLSAVRTLREARAALAVATGSTQEALDA